MYDSLITVIVPVYNTEKYLHRCINSIRNQTYSNLEIILIDDGSTDQSGFICDEFAQLDSRIKVIHKQNEGQGIARNRGLDIARGEYIGFVDSDDYIDQFMYEKLLKSCIDNKCDIAICGYIRDHLFTKRPSPAQKDTIIYNRKELFISYLKEPYIQGIMCNKLFISSLFSELRFSTLRAREDAEIIYKVFGKCQKAVYIPFFLYTQYVRPGSTELSGFNSSKYATIRFFSEMQEYVDSILPDITSSTELLVASACSAVIKQIMSDKCPSKHKQELDSALALLQAELEKHRVHAGQNDALYMKFQHELAHKNRLYIKCRQRYWVTKVQSAVKIMLAKFYFEKSDCLSK